MGKCWVFTLSVAFVGCANQPASPDLRAPLPQQTREVAAREHLTSPEGPDRFAQVSNHLYRGGQPSLEDLEALRTIGVTTIINLRAEALGQRRAEWADARELGLTYLEYPFFGIFGAQPDFLEEVIGALISVEGEAIYVHDKDGRDRTSLIVALYRVCVDGWAPDEAWNREVLDYGHRVTPFSREIELTFWDHTTQRERWAATKANGRAARAKTAQNLARVDNRSESNSSSENAPDGIRQTVARTPLSTPAADRSLTSARARLEPGATP